MFDIKCIVTYLHSPLADYIDLTRNFFFLEVVPQCKENNFNSK
jgi:hypothetical protein